MIANHINYWVPSVEGNRTFQYWVGGRPFGCVYVNFVLRLSKLDLNWRSVGRGGQQEYLGSVERSFIKVCASLLTSGGVHDETTEDTRRDSERRRDGGESVVPTQGEVEVTSLSLWKKSFLNGIKGNDDFLDY